MTTRPDDITDDAFLGGALSMLQPRKGFRAGIDGVLLAASVGERGSAVVRALDAGSGVGVAGLCLARRLANVRVDLIERDPHLAGLASRNVERNGLSGRASVIEADLLLPGRGLADLGIRDNSYDVALANPPWHEDGRGRASSNPIKARANAMPSDDLDLWARALVRLVAPGGLLCMIHRADALSRVLASLEARFGAIQVLPIHSKRNTAANRILIRAIKGSRAPLTLCAGLVVHADDGSFQPDVASVLREGAPLRWPTE